MTSVTAEGDLGRVDIRGLNDGVAAVGAVLSESGDDAGFRVEPAAAGRFGVGLLVCYYRGRVNYVRLTLRPLEVDAIRIETHGFACRMQKAYVDIDRHGEVRSQGEEILSCTVDRRDDGELHISLEFVAHRTMREWLYVFATTAAPEAAAFSIRRFSSASAPVPVESYRETEIRPVYRSGALFRLNDIRVFRNYLHIEFELCKHGTHLTALGLQTTFKLEAVQWWTAQTVRPAQATFSEETIVLSRRAPSFPLYSPAAMEAYGPAEGWLGHCVTALYADLHDWRLMDVARSDSALFDLVFHARFEDGTEVAFPAFEQVPCEEATEVRELKDFGRTRAGTDQPVMLEIGCRGPHSVRMRTELASFFRYVGLDMFEGPNVDVVGDAHALSRSIDPGSVDVVYANSVIEHLAHPMGFIIEANKVLRAGGLLMLNAPTTWALHAEPWDFWRFNVHTWPNLLNGQTGFEIVSVCEMGEASIVPMIPRSSGMTRMQYDPAPLGTRVVARKTGAPTVAWPDWTPTRPAGRYDH